MRLIVLILISTAAAFGQCTPHFDPLLGRLTCPPNPATGAGTGTVTSVGLVGTANQLTVTGTSPITGSGSWTISIPSAFTLPGILNIKASATGASGANYAAGTAPTSPASGDFWNTGTLLQFRNNAAATKTIAFLDSNITGTAALATAIAGGSSGQVAFQSGAGVTAFSSGLAYNDTTKVLGLIGGFTAGTTGTGTGTYAINGTSSGTVTITGASAAGTWTLTLPTSGGTNGYALVTNGSGVTSWSATTASTAAGITGKTFLGDATQIPQFSGTPTSGRCVETDSNGNLVVTANGCASGGQSDAGDPNSLGKTCAASATVPYDSYTDTSSPGSRWVCTWNSVASAASAWYLLPSTIGSGAYTISAVSGTVTADVAANRPACTTNFLYYATDTFVLSQSSAVTDTCTTLNPSGSVALIFDSTAKTIKTYASDGTVYTLGTGSSGSGVGRSTLSATWTAIADGTCQQQSDTWSGSPSIGTTDTLMLGIPAALTLTAVARITAANTVAIRICNLSGASVTPGPLTFQGVLAIYNVVNTSNINFGAILDGSYATNTFTLTGAVAGEPLAAQVPAALEDGLVWSMRVSAANTVTVTLWNFSGATVNPASGTFGASVVR